MSQRSVIESVINPFTVSGTSPPRDYSNPEESVFMKCSKAQGSSLALQRHADNVPLIPLLKLVPASESLLGTLTFQPILNYQPLSKISGVSQSDAKFDNEIQSKVPVELNGVPKPHGEAGSQGPRIVSVKELASLYGLKTGAVYALIKTEPTFPYKNVGLRKKFVVNVSAFDKWISDRTEREKNGSFQIPTATSLIERYRK